MQPPAFGLNDTPAEFFKTLNAYSLRGRCSLAIVDPRFQLSNFDPCLYFVFLACGAAVGGWAPHTDGISGCFRRDFMDLRCRLGARGQGRRGRGQGAVEDRDFPVATTQQKFTKAPRPIPATPELRASNAHAQRGKSGWANANWVSCFGWQRFRAHTPARLWRSKRQMSFPCLGVTFTRLMIPLKLRKDGSRPRFSSTGPDYTREL